MIRKINFKEVLFWIIALILAVGISIYQRITGPTFPVKGKTEISGKIVEYSLPRSHSGDGDKQIMILIPDTSVSADLKFRRFIRDPKMQDEWSLLPMIRSGDTLAASIPHQPPAGKIEYYVIVKTGVNESSLVEKPTIIRFTGAVPNLVLILHIILIYLAMIVAFRTGIEAIFIKKKTYQYTVATVILLFVSGLVLGPIVQFYAFGEFWTGFPFGHDLTDNKILVSFILWLFALYRLKKNPQNHYWALIALAVMLLTYLIPHSVLGSELDYTKMPK
jgi:hypothetical protein